MISIKRLKNKGFTLIELLVVIAIIGVLTAVLLVNLVGIRERGADTKMKSDLRQLKTAMRLYYNDNQQYPPVGANSTFTGCGSGGGSSCGEGVRFPTTGSAYINSVPAYDFYARPNADSFVLGVTLNNSGDPDIAKSHSECGLSVAGMFYVCSD
jgi:prepilin-type N-terminal cleavage/methylation domain-containing protein